MSNPRPITPNRDTRLRENMFPNMSFAESILPAIDAARQIPVDLGLRPYKVHSVVLKWSGGAPGKGTAKVESDIPFLPVPTIEWDSGHDKRALSGGVVERGSATLTKISLRYTEDDLAALFHSSPLPADREAFIETRIDQRDGQTVRRRYAIKGLPYRDQSKKWEWRVKLIAQDADRERDGTPPTVGRFF